MKKHVIVAVLFCSIGMARAQTPAPATPVQPPSQAWTEHYRKSTVALGIVQNVGATQRFNVIGAGVLISPDSQHVILVTAKHVFDEPQQNWHPAQLRVRFSSQENKSFTDELGTPIQLLGPLGSNLWSALNDGSDIAAIPLTMNFAGLVTDAIGYKDFAQADDVYDGSSVFVFGFPGDVSPLIGENGLARAVTRSGVIAWTDPAGALENPLLLDSNILPGNSGGPAFRVPTGLGKYGSFNIGGRVAFLGIVTADLSKYYVVQADGRIIAMQFPDLPVPSIEQVQVVGIGGLGRVEPAFKVKKLVDEMIALISNPIAPPVH